MQETQHFGLIGGLGVGATKLYYDGITAGCTDRSRIPRMTIAHAHAPTALAHVQAGRISGLADYLAGFAHELEAAGATRLAIPAITPHICRSELTAQISLPLVDILDVTARTITARGHATVALFGTRYTIDSRLFGRLDGVNIVRAHEAEVDEIHRIYLDLAQKGACSTADVARLRDIADILRQRDGVDAIVLAGTDLNLIFDEASAGFPAIDCAAAHVAAIVDAMCADAVSPIA